MFQSALASVEQALLTIDGADTNIQILMSTLRVKLLQLKADILFNIRQSVSVTINAKAVLFAKQFTPVVYGNACIVKR